MKFQPSWISDDLSDQEKQELVNLTRASTFADIMDKWRVFWEETLESQREREMMRKLLRNQFQDDPKDELVRINKMARALKGDLEK